MSPNKIKLNLDSLKSRKEWKRHKVKDGHNIYRILPPFGESSNGYPYRKWQVIWGLTDPESGRARPFASSMTSEKRCPVSEYVQELKQRAETMSSQLKAAGYSDEDIRARLKDLNDLIGNIVPKTVYVYNACDKSGEVGLLELKATAHKDMKEKMNKYIQDYNQDPTSLNSADDDSGVWFDVVRSNATGKFRDTTYKVDKVQTKVKNGATFSYVDDRSPLPDQIVENYDNLAYDLSSIYQVKTYEQLAEVLQANMANIVQFCPDADLSVEPSLEAAAQPAAAAAAAPATKATPLHKGVGKVAMRLDDDDSEAPLTSGTAARAAATVAHMSPNIAHQPAKATTNAVADDDFMAEAEAFLNG